MNIFRRSTLGLLLLPMLALACAGGGDSESASTTDSGSGSSVGYSGDQTAAAPPVAMERTAAGRQAERPDIQADSAPATAAPAPQMIIRNGTATVRVDELEPAIAAVRRLAERLGGYVANSTVRSGEDEEKGASMEVKIPSARFEQAVAGLAPIGKLEEQQTTSQDVGEEYTDVAARMANAQRLEQRLLTLLETRTGKLEDVLTVERELARVRGEIESAEGRLRYLRSRVALSTLTIELTEGGAPNPIGRAFEDSWRNFVGFVASLVGALGWLVPLLITLAILWRFARWLFRNNPNGFAWPQGPYAPRPATAPRPPAAPPARDTSPPPSDTPPAA